MSNQQSTETQDHKIIQKREVLPAAGESAELLSSTPSALAVQRAIIDPGSLNPTDVAALQRSHGNQFVQRLLNNGRSAASTPPSLLQRRVPQGSISTEQRIQRWDLLDSVSEGASSLWEGTKNVAKNSWEGTKNVASSAWEGTKNTAKNSWEGTKNTASAAWEGTKSLASSAWEGTKNTASSAWEGTKRLGTGAVRGTVKAAKATWNVVEGITYHSDYADLNGKQFRVSFDGGGVLVEQVVAGKNEEGALTYVAVGKVTGYTGNRPIIEPYPQARALRGWTPRVTHLNGMLVNPEEGIGSAKLLHKSINDALKEQALLDEAGVDVLYTYSASRGFGTDLGECMVGKLYIDDQITHSQEEIMLNAIRTKQRTTVSAHSRGTIKTDNAVRNVYNQLHKEYMAIYRQDDAVLQEAEEVADTIMMDPAFIEMGFDREMALVIATQQVASEKARVATMAEMDQYIQLIYAGNAVQFPSSALKGDLFVGQGDLVSMSVGKYANWATPERMTMHKVKGGHEFDTNYAKDVGKLTAGDISQRGR